MTRLPWKCHRAKPMKFVFFVCDFINSFVGRFKEDAGRQYCGNNLKTLH